MNSDVDEAALRRLATWRAEYGAGDRFQARLAVVGLTEAELVWLLGESVTSLAGRTVRPSWVSTVENALATAGARRVTALPVYGDRRDVFAALLRPFVMVARDRLIERARPFTASANALLPDLVDRFCRVPEPAVGADRDPDVQA